MTEDEARKKVCPYFARELVAAGYATDDANCLGSGCMLWREEMIIYNLTQDAPQESLTKWSTKDEKEFRPTGNGYCGLAGKP